MKLCLELYTLTRTMRWQIVKKHLIVKNIFGYLLTKKYIYNSKREYLKTYILW